MNAKSAQLSISRLYQTTPKNLFDAWTQPEIFTQWMGPGSVVCEKFEIDLTEGGSYTIYLRTDDGIKIAKGSYIEISRYSKLSFSWEWEGGSFKDSVVHLEFTEKDGGTELLLNHCQLPTPKDAEQHTHGWNGSMEKLEKIVSDFGSQKS